MEGKRIQIRAKSNGGVTPTERVCDAYRGDDNQITLEFKKGKVLTTITLRELNTQLRALNEAN